jgi:hypothetical protein
MLYDSTRGVGQRLHSDQNVAEATETADGTITSFDSDGFTLDAGTSSDFYTNDSGATYVAWNWKANAGSTSSNTDGSITSTVQANTTAGFSIVTYTGTGSNATVGHGLGVVPDMVIVKNRSSSADWGVQMANTLGFTNALRLNLTDAYGGANGAGWWNDIAPTSTTVSIGTRSEVNTNGNNYVMYCFNNVEGYSKFGSYTGNGSDNGAFVYTGFRPAFVLLKAVDNTFGWNLFDSKRLGYNIIRNRVFPHNSNAESSSTGNGIDIYSNGFKLRTTNTATNGSGGTYIYMCFAENPFVSSTKIPVVAR